MLLAALALVLIIGVLSRVAWPSPQIPVVTTPLATQESASTTALTPASDFTIYLPVIVGEDMTSLPAEPTLVPTVQLPTVAPSPTPLQWPEPLAGQTSSKLGIHLTNNSDPYVMEFIRRVHPRLVK